MESRVDCASGEPQITSPDQQERILARRLRIQKRSLVAKKRLLTIENGTTVNTLGEGESVVELQVENSTVELLTLTHEGKELITNVRVAADGYEVKRRADQGAAKDVRLKKLEEEAQLAQEKFDIISAKWEQIAKLKVPLDLHEETEKQRDKCKDLIQQKDELVKELKAELIEGDVRFVKDQQKQSADVTLLVERIDSQIAIMRRAYRRELLLIEQAIDIERRDTMEVNNRQWEVLYKQREEDEIGNLHERFVALSEHNQLMQNILVHHQEKFRATKISLEKDIQVLQQQLEQVKAICLLNKEKMEYNYQVLKKRDEESLLIRSQQKRRINKLQDVVTTLRRKIATMEQSTQAEVKRLTSEVMKLHRNIKDIRMKAHHFRNVNQAKYFQLWKFNHDSAQKLLDKIVSIDRLIYEQHLGMEWLHEPPRHVLKEDLSSFKLAIARRSHLKSEVEGVVSKTDESSERLLKHILKAVADRAGFLVEDRLAALLAPYTSDQATLVRIDNVFSALGVTRQQDMELLRQTMQPYIVCTTCHPLLSSVHPVSPSPLSTPRSLSEEEMKVRVVKKIHQTMEEGEKILALRKEKHSTFDDGENPFQLSSSIVSTGLTGSTMAPWTAPSDMSPRTASQHEMKSIIPSLFTMVFSSRQPNTIPDISSSETTIAHTATVWSEKLDAEEGKDMEEEDILHDPSHKQSINPIFVLKALQDFVRKFQSMKHRGGGTLGEKSEENKSISRQISNEDVKRYWEQFRDAFPPEREKLWDCLYLGLQRYHSILQDRHRINQEIEHLKIQNTELRRLLQKYALPNNMKQPKSMRNGLPPLSVKTPTAPAPSPAPARLILSFNNTSRV